MNALCHSSDFDESKPHIYHHIRRTCFAIVQISMRANRNENRIAAAIRFAIVQISMRANRSILVSPYDRSFAIVQISMRANLCFLCIGWKNGFAIVQISMRANHKARYVASERALP